MRKIAMLVSAPTGILAVGLMLGMGPADAAPGGRDVIGDAEAVCADRVPGTLIDSACDILEHTAGPQDIGNVHGQNCLGEFDAGDGSILTYVGRNCDGNEEALLRKIGSAVLSLDDYLGRFKEKQAQTAVNYVCSYASKLRDLAAAGKVIGASEDLATDADDLADGINEDSTLVAEGC